MIKRIWRGWTTHEDAAAYIKLLKTFVFPGIEAKRIPGYRSIELLHRRLPDEVEFMTVMTFDSLENVVSFQGDDYEKCYVPQEAQSILRHWEEVSNHYDVEEVRHYGDQ